MLPAGSELLPITMIRLGARPADKAAAIAEAAQMLVAAGYVDAGYAQSMARREAVANTFLGSGVAIPHGLGEDRHMVRKNGLAIVQIPDGVTWNEDQTAHLVVAIAAQSDTHITVLRRLTRLLQDSELLARLATTDDAALIAQALGSDEPAEAAPAQAATDFASSFDWTVDYPTGLHARPASAWVETARRFAAPMRVRNGNAAADPKNLIALLQLGLRAGEQVTISAEGADAEAALAALRATITSLSAQEKADAALAASRAKQAARPGWTPPGALSSISGAAAAPGLAIGRLHVISATTETIEDRPIPLVDGAALLQEALTHTRQQLQALADDTARRLGATDAGIFKAQAELLGDTDLITQTCQLMVEGHGVAWAWHATIERVAEQLAGVGNPVLAARAADLRDVGRRVLGHIDPALKARSLRDLPDEPCILVAVDLSPSDTAGLDPSRVIGIATAQGGPTSHTAILARTLGVPALVGGGAALFDLTGGTLAILDGQAGRLYLQPDEADLASARTFEAARAAERAREEEARALPARTTDGTEISIGANINLPDQAAFALAQGAEGVGLMRTEFLFLERSATPSEDEQYAIYRAMSQALGGRQLIVRALDIGGDKQVAHLDLPHEENPFLGVRGARLLLRRPDLLEPQLRALYRAAKDGAEILIMFPMITSLGELLALRQISERIREELDAPIVPLGIMIEVPAAAIQAESLARHADFFSIGTNDLTQYTLAIDRQNPQLAPEVDSLHPAVLRLIKATVDGARVHGRWVGVCGGIAGEPFGAALLAGLGCSELSMTPREVPGVKARLRASSMADLKALAEKALACESGEDVRALDGDRP
ncbi:phosphoenolpyruvate--protein phosphotransferase [Ancylobacter sp. VKM B-3255]|uniref:phosphoenolpyruvate--protein phosphotransferase n=2 Tax=Ancylobacter radicis TaxID=2836179 RepID=A0ABS5R7M0_9HYPH|nr:phosphoenolpyruvate--protein phosphotransferase [Ancylobacter radicis]